MTLDPDIISEITEIADRFNVSKLSLFGSRAKDTCNDRSDIDLAAYFESPNQYYDFCDALESIPTLLMFDVVNLNSDAISLDLRKCIQDEGVMLNAKI